MGFKDCIVGRIESGKLDDRKGKALVKEYEERVNNLMAKGRSLSEAEAFADKILNKEVARLQQKQRAMINLALKKKDFDTRLAQSGKPVAEFLKNELQMTASRVETVKHQVFGLLKENLDKISVDVFGRGRDYETFVNAIMIGLGKKIDDPSAVALSQAIRLTNDTLHGMYEAAGGVLGKIDNYMVKQVHAKVPIVKAGFDKWKQDLLPLLDMNKMLDESTGLPFEPAKLEGVLRDIYDDIETNGRASLQKAMDAGEDVGFGMGDINTRRDKSRFLQFKTPDAFREYNNLYGVGDTGLPLLFINHMESMSRDIAVMEKLSSRPNDFMKYADRKMSLDEKSGPIARRGVQADYRVLTSQFQAGDTDALWWNLLTGTLNITRSAMLANGFLATLSDPAILSKTMKMNGLTSTRALKFYAKNLAPRGKELTELAERTGFVNDMVQGAAIGDTRFTGESMGNGLPRVLANVMNTINGQQRATVSVQRAAFYELMATIADDVSRKTSWANLGEDFKIAAEAYGIKESDWADIINMPIYENGQGRFLISSDVRADKAYLDSFKERFKTEAEARMFDRISQIDARKETLNRFVDLKDRVYQLDELKVSTKELDKTIARDERRLRSLKDEYKKYVSGSEKGLSPEEITSRTRDYKADLDAVKKEASSLKSDLTSLKRDQIIAQNDLERARESYRRQFQKNKDEVKFSKDDTATTGKRATSTANAGAVNKIAKRVDELNSKIDGIKAKLDELDERKVNLEDKLEGFGDGRENPINKIKEVEDSLNQKRSELKEKDAAFEQLKTELRRATATRKDLKGTPSEVLDQIIRDIDSGVKRAEQFDVGADADEFLNTRAKQRVKELADKIDDWGNDLSRIASTEPTLRTKSITTGAIMGSGIGPGGAGGAATIERAVGATLGLFKSFPLTYTMVHLVPPLRKILAGKAGSKEATQLGLTILGATVGGAVTVQLKNLTQGKETQDMNDHKFWLKSMLTGGGAGLFGDFLFADYSRFGRSPITEIGGPVVGLINDVARATKGNFDRFAEGKDTNVSRDLLRIGIRNLPLVHVWYARLLMDRLLLDNVERMVDPDYDKRIRKYERKLRKETGQEFWWSPGQMRPDIVK